MATASVTSFNSYTFSYQWTVNDLEARVCHLGALTSPIFTSPEGAKPATKWRLSISKQLDYGQRSRESTDYTISNREEYVSVTLERLVSNDRSTSSSQSMSLVTQSKLFATQNSPRKTALESLSQKEPKIWVEAHLKTPRIVYKEKRETVALLVKRPTNVSNKCYRDRGDINITMQEEAFFNRCLLISKLRDSVSVTFDCEIKVWLLDDPIHKPMSLHTTVPVPEFNLGKLMDEDRRKNLFTDVTLVAAEKKEFRAHKAVLASQSNFFKTRFASRWQDQKDEQSSDRVEMTDVPDFIMEAMISYMYTGEVAGLGKVAASLLPFAEEYGLEGLRKMCEHELAKSLTSDNAIDLLINANAHNAPDLKKVCMDYIILNLVSLRESKDWRKLKETQAYHDLWVELLEKLADQK